MILQQCMWEQFRRHTDRAVVFDEAVGRPVRDIGAEVFIEPTRRRAAGDALREHRLPRLAVRRGDIAFIALASLPMSRFHY